MLDTLQSNGLQPNPLRCNEIQVTADDTRSLVRCDPVAVALTVAVTLAVHAGVGVGLGMLPTLLAEDRKCPHDPS